MNFCGIDPGQQGAFILLENNKLTLSEVMPLTKEKEIDFDGVMKILGELPDDTHVFLERAMPMAMGAKHAFNYGRGFAALEIALRLTEKPVTYVEPAKWGKVIHEGISGDLKPKAKSRIAIERLFPKLLSLIPKSKNGNYHEGIMEAILIAEYGRRKMK